MAKPLLFPITTRSSVIKANAKGAGAANVRAAKAAVAGGQRAYGLNRKVPGGPQ